MMMIIQEELPTHELIERLAEEFLLELGKSVKFETVGACLELSENSEDKARVHLHGYLGTDIKGGVASMCGVVQADVDYADLIFSGVKPFVRATRPKRKRPKTIFDAVVNGLYYVVAKKTTSILRHATVWPIQDTARNRRDYPSLGCGRFVYEVS